MITLNIDHNIINKMLKIKHIINTQILFVA